MKKQSTPKKNNSLLYHIRARPTLSLAAAVGVGLLLVLPPHWHYSTRLLIAWDGGMLFYLAAVLMIVLRATPDTIRRNAAMQDEGRNIFLALTIIATLASLLAIVAELATARNMAGGQGLLHVGLAAATVVLSWVFMQTIFALHYAHDYYMAMDSEAIHGLEFPGHPRVPDYWDFFYFSFVIGAAAQTADVNVTSHLMRRTVMAQCIIVFFFNAAVVALTINIGAGLLAMQP